MPVQIFAFFKVRDKEMDVLYHKFVTRNKQQQSICEKYSCFTIKNFSLPYKKEEIKMKDKKLKGLVKEIVQQTRAENLNYSHYPMPVYEEKMQMDNEERKTILDTKCEEAARHEYEKKNQQLHKEEYMYKELTQYKRELEKERKARKKALEQQTDLKYAVKNLQNQLKEVEKKYQKSEKEQQKKYKKLKAVIKKKNRKQKNNIKSIKNILVYIACMSGSSFYGKSLEETEKFYKDWSRHIKKSKNPYIEGSYKEIL